MALASIGISDQAGMVFVGDIASHPGLFYPPAPSARTWPEAEI
jgi:hypothetical protein